ncbi:nucleotide exchange factor GrpE [Aerococcaceae bacterium 50-4]
MDDNQQDLNVDEEINETDVQEEQADAATEDSELTSLQADLEAKEDQIMRLSAEIQNMHRRNQTERESASKYRSQNLAKGILPAIDNLERALEMAQNDESSQQLVKGIEMVHASLLQALAEEGIEVIDPKGEIFDPNFHQSVSAVPAEEGQQAEEVVAVFQKGYVLKDRVLRPAMVTIAQ